MARRLRFVRPFALSSSLLLNLHAFCTTTNSFTLPMPIHPPTYFLHTHTCAVLLIHFTSYYFINHSRAALFVFAFRSMNTVLYAPSSRTRNNFLAAYINFFSLFIQRSACLPSCLPPSRLVCSASLDAFLFLSCWRTLICSRWGIIRSVTQRRDVNN
jgi:hypothetical protein